MLQHLENKYLRVAVDTFGAEVQSIVNRETGFEYLWDGRPEFWKRRSPVLFPIVGSVWNGTFRMDGIEYSLGQHGFARDMEFTPFGDRSDELWYALEATESTLAKYPRRFRLEIGYRLDGRSLRVMWRVHNLDKSAMDFQIGAHPALMMPDFHPDDPVHAYFSFDRDGLQTEILNPDGAVGSGHRPVALNDRLLAIGPHTFDCGTYIFGDSQLRRVDLLDKEESPVVSVSFDAPYLGLWSPRPDCPFVCIEPWYGRADREGFDGDFADRTAVNRLLPDQTFEAGYSMEFY